MRGGEIKTYCSDAIYLDETGAKVRPKARVGRQCVPTREVHGPCGTGPTLPRCHSETAALQDLFDIPGGTDASIWADKIESLFDSTPAGPPEEEKEADTKIRHIRRLFGGELTCIYVSLYNSGNEPCKDHDKSEKVPCDEFLRKAANKVNGMPKDDPAVSRRKLKRDGNSSGTHIKMRAERRKLELSPMESYQSLGRKLLSMA